MFNISDNYLSAYKALSRKVIGAVVCEVDSGTVNMNPDGSLVKFTIEKTAPKGKLFGFAVSQKITIEALGILNDIKKGHRLIPSIGIADYEDEVIDLPYFYVDTVEFNKVKNTTTIVGYDILHKTDTLTIGKLSFEYPLYSGAYIRDVIEYVGGYAEFEGIDFVLRQDPNFDGTETIHTALTAFAEFTGTICYVSHGDNVKFRAMASSDFTDVLTADDYIDLAVGEPVTLSKIGSANELGDNIYTGEDGFTQVLWENPFMDATTNDAAAVLEAIGAQVRNLTNIDYTLEWRGCPAYEMGDFIILQEKDGTTQYAHYFNEVLEFNGGLRATSEWAAGDGDTIEGTPATLGTALKMTYATVNKVAGEIDLYAAQIDDLNEQVAQIKVDNESIQQSVSDMQTTTDELNGQVTTLSSKVESTMTDSEIELLVSNEIISTLGAQEVQEVRTTTGFVFDAAGLTVSRSGSDLTTTVSENGLTVDVASAEMLTANAHGVYAKNLRATTYLYVGSSRFEDYEHEITKDKYGKWNGTSLGKRTGVFWIGEV